MVQHNTYSLETCCRGCAYKICNARFCVISARPLSATLRLYGQAVTFFSRWRKPRPRCHPRGVEPTRFCCRGDPADLLDLAVPDEVGPPILADGVSRLDRTILAVMR